MTGLEHAALAVADATRPELLAAVARAVAGESADGPGGRPEVRVRWHRRRPRCALAALDVVDGSVTHAVVVKARADRATERAGARHGRPRVAGGEVGAGAAAVLEHAGLVILERAVSASRLPGLAAVRPLALLPEHDALVMAEVAQPTLKDRLQRSSRVHRAGPEDLRPWRHAGELLAAYQREPAPAATRPWLATPQELADLVGRLLDYLRSRSAPEGLLRDVERLTGRLLPEVPEPVPLVASHGDFVPRNLFVGDDGSVALFDPMPGWSVPPAYDLATFCVGLRLNGWQLASRGAAFARSRLDAFASAVLAGHGTGPDDALLRLLVLVVLLDRWSWLASPPAAAGARGTLSAVKLAWLRGALLAEVRRPPALVR
ncbi:MAG TPA: phosphotransferase [Mycobacteriales bacterium]|nr:phosphotransferase [Mycobacteriales bacterium]